MKRRGLLLCAALLLSVPAFARTEPPAETGGLGKLFMTPEKRHALERQRQLDPGRSDGIESDTLRLDGVVRRSSGRGTVWLNQRQQPDRNGDAGATELPLENGNSARLRVGETINRTTKEREDVVAPNSVRIRASR